MAIIIARVQCAVVSCGRVHGSVLGKSRGHMDTPVCFRHSLSTHRAYDNSQRQPRLHSCQSQSSHRCTDETHRCKVPLYIDVVQGIDIQRTYAPTEEMLADFLTQPTSVANLRWCCDELIQDNSTCWMGHARNQTNAISSPSDTCPHEWR